MKTYTVETHFTFIGTFTVKAESKAEAIRIIEEDTGLVMGGDIHTNNDEQVTNWDFNTHPEKRCVSLTF